MKPEFHNKENECVETVDGWKVWLSRSCAVAMTTIWTKESNIGEYDWNKDSVLLVKRVDDMDMEPGKYCLPCGYLDYDESLINAAIRELYEETGFNIDGHDGPLREEQFPSILNAAKGTQPWLVHSEPNGDALQNVTHHFGCSLRYEEDFPFKAQANEISWVGLVPIKDLDDYNIAFNHANRIRQFWHFLHDGSLDGFII